MVLCLQNCTRVPALICALALILCERMNFYCLLVTAERVAVYVVFGISKFFHSTRLDSKCGSSGYLRTLVSYQDKKPLTI